MLKLTTDIADILVGRGLEVSANTPAKAMDTITLPGSKLVISPTSQGLYRVELWRSSKSKPRVVHVEPRDGAQGPYPGPSKFLRSAGLLC